MKLGSADARQAAGKLGHGLNQNAGLVRRGGQNLSEDELPTRECVNIAMDRKRSLPPSREQIEERSSFQKWILLNGNLKALLRQELLNFL